MGVTKIVVKVVAKEESWSEISDYDYSLGMAPPDCGPC